MTAGTIPELNYLLQLVEKHYNSKISTTTDFEALSTNIENETGELLSVSTLKRLFGYVNMRPLPRKSTLDILSRYIGHNNYEEFRKRIKDSMSSNSMFFSTKVIYSSALKPGTRIMIGWSPDRIVTLEHIGNEEFTVLESVNSHLKAGDRFKQVSFMMEQPLFISEIIRDGACTPPYIAGLQGGLNLLELL